MIHRENILEHNAETVDFSKRGVSEWSLPAEATVPGDPWAPSAPTISAAAADQAIDLTLTRPATNVDGTTCTDFKEFKVYYSASSGIDTSNPSTYDGTFYTQATNHTYPTTATTYFVATAIDKNGNESSASSEVNATPTSSGYSPSIDDYTNNIANIYVGDGMLGIEFQPPKSTWVRWAGWKLYYDVNTGSGWSGSWTEIYIGSGPGFVHKGLTTTYAYKYKLTALGEDGSETTGTISDNSGAGYTPNATDNSAVVAVTIFAENLIATNEVRAPHIKAGEITADKLSFTALNLDTDDLDDVPDGTTYGRVLKTDISAGHILLSETVGDLDDIADGTAYGRVASTDISAGHITVVSEQASININSSTFGADGIQLQYNAGNPRAYIGNGSDKYFKFDGTNVYISGNLTILGGSGIDNLSDAGALATLDVVGTAQITDLSFSKITAGTSNASITIGSSGYIKSSNYSAGSAGFKIDGDGDAEFNDVTVRGALIAQSGSNINGLYIGSDTIPYGKLQSNSVRTNEIYIDGDIDFAATGTRQGIKGLQDIYFDSGKSTSYPYIELNSGNILIEEKAGGARLYLEETGVSLTNGGYNATLTISSGGDIFLNSQGQTNGVLNYSGTTVFNGNAPTSWNGLNLSSYVGSRRALVLLMVHNGSSSTNSYRFSHSTSYEQGTDPQNYPGVFSTRIGATRDENFVWCLTDSSGNLFWWAELGYSTTITLLAYIT